jgi:hypothetical protein
MILTTLSPDDVGFQSQRPKNVLTIPPLLLAKNQQLTATVQLVPETTVFVAENRLPFVLYGYEGSDLQPGQYR